MVEVCSQSHGWRRCLGNARGVRLGWELGDLGENRRSKEEELLGSDSVWKNQLHYVLLKGKKKY